MYQAGHVMPKQAYTMEDYTDLTTAEREIRSLDRILYKVGRFNRRAQLDHDNHARRQARMEERAKARRNELRIWNDKDEAELQYNDYYETEGEQEDEAEALLEAYEELYASQVFDFDKYQFVEEGVHFPQPPARNQFLVRAFKFQNRMWNDPPHVFFARQQRMISRFFDRKKDTPDFDVAEIQEAMKKDGYIEAVKKAEPYREYMMSEAIQQYKDYYETDQEDLENFEYMNDEERLLFARVYKDYSKTSHADNVLSLVDVSDESGLTGVTDALKHLLPKAKAEAAKATVHKFT